MSLEKHNPGNIALLSKLHGLPLHFCSTKSKNFDDTKYLLFLIEPTVSLNFICLKVTFDLKKKNHISDKSES